MATTTFTVGSDADKLKLVKVDNQDTVSTFVTKVNANFENIAQHGGGPAGADGQDGKDGEDGSITEYLYTLSDIMEEDINYPSSYSEKNTLFNNASNNDTATYEYTTWSSTPLNISSDYKNEYIWMRTQKPVDGKLTGEWKYSDPVLWSHWGEDAEIIKLISTATSIKIDSNNNIYPSTLTCKINKETSRYKIYYGYDNEEKEYTSGYNVLLDKSNYELSVLNSNTINFYLAEDITSDPIDIITIQIIHESAGTSSSITTEYRYARFNDNWGSYVSASLPSDYLKSDEPYIKFTSESNNVYSYNNVKASTSKDSVNSNYSVLVEIRRTVTTYSDNTADNKSNWSQPIIVARQFDNTTDDLEGLINTEINESINNADSALRKYLETNYTTSAAFTSYTEDAANNYASIDSIAANVTYLRNDDGFLYTYQYSDHTDGVYEITGYKTVEAYVNGTNDTDKSELVPISDELSYIRQYVDGSEAGVDIIAKVQGEDGNNIVAAIFERASEEGSQIHISADQIVLNGDVTLTDTLYANNINAKQLNASDDEGNSAILNANTFELSSPDSVGTGTNSISLYIDKETVTFADGSPHTNVPTLMLTCDGVCYKLDPTMWSKIGGDTNTKTFYAVKVLSVALETAQNTGDLISGSTTNQNTFINATKSYYGVSNYDSLYNTIYHPISAYVNDSGFLEDTDGEYDNSSNYCYYKDCNGVRNQILNEDYSNLSNYDTYKYNGFLYITTYSCAKTSSSYSWVGTHNEKLSLTSEMINNIYPLDIIYKNTTQKTAKIKMSKLPSPEGYQNYYFIGTISLRLSKFVDIGTSQSRGTRAVWVPMIEINGNIQDTANDKIISSIYNKYCYSYDDFENAFGNIVYHYMSDYSTAIQPFIGSNNNSPLTTDSPIYKMMKYLNDNNLNK